MSAGLDLSFDDAQQSIADALGQFCEERCPYEAVKELENGFSPELWRELAELGVLALMTPDGDGGAVELAAACEALGWEWFESEECGAERLLPGCVTYSRLVQQGELIDAGNHEVAICRLERVFGPGEAEGQASAGLNTAELREAGLITAAGRAVEPAS